MKILLERGAEANTQNKVSSFRPVQCLLLMSSGKCICMYVDCESDL